MKLMQIPLTLSLRCRGHHGAAAWRRRDRRVRWVDPFARAYAQRNPSVFLCAITPLACWNMPFKPTPSRSQPSPTECIPLNQCNRSGRRGRRAWHAWRAWRAWRGPHALLWLTTREGARKSRPRVVDGFVSLSAWGVAHPSVGCPPVGMHN
jgi:hypothetical protein